MATHAMLYPITTIAHFLHVKASAVSRMIDQDGLPAIRVPTDRKNIRKIPLRQFHSWLSKRSENIVPSLDELTRKSHTRES